LKQGASAATSKIEIQSLFTQLLQDNHTATLQPTPAIYKHRPRVLRAAAGIYMGKPVSYITLLAVFPKAKISRVEKYSHTRL
jgi:hypothetical protein